MLSIIIIETVKQVRKHFALRRVFNINKELRVSKVKPYKPEKSLAPSTYLGLSQNKKRVLVPNDAKHVLICGTTGSGKTVALSNFVSSGIENGYPMLVVDGKGDVDANSLSDIVSQLGHGRKLYYVNLNDPASSDKYNPFQNASSTVIKDMLINMTDWSEEHYKLNTERYLQRLIDMLFIADDIMCFKNIIRWIPVNNFIALSADMAKKELISKQAHVDNVELAKASGKIAESAAARFSTIAESEIGSIFSEDGIDIYTAFKENAIIFFVLNPLLYPEVSPLIGRLILIDSKKAVHKLFGSAERKFFIFDEISVYASPALLDLVNKSRSANVTCVLSTQSLSDLDSAAGEHFKEQIIENCNNYLVLRQNSAVNSEAWANILGTKRTLDVTYQIAASRGHMFTEDTGYGSARRTREFIYHPDDIKTLRLGQGIFMCKDKNVHSRVAVHKPFRDLEAETRKEVH